MRIIDAKSMVAICKSNYEDWKRLMYHDLLAIDDLGTEAREVMDYGNIINPTVDIITRRYENQFFTIISTNLTPPQISQVYGERIADRMREMMEIIPFTNTSYRVLKESRSPNRTFATSATSVGTLFILGLPNVQCQKWQINIVLGLPSVQ